MVDRYVQSANPLSCVLESPLNTDEIPDIVYENKTNFYKRCIELDIKKHVFDFMGEVKPDYLVIDAGSMRKPLFFAGNNKKKCATLIFDNTAQQLFEQGAIPSYTKGDIWDFDNEEISGLLDIYINKIKEICAEENIILIESYDVPYSIDLNSQNVGCFDEKRISMENDRIKYGYNYLRSKLTKCHVIEFPKGVVGDKNHTWGEAPLHYVPEYYEYGAKAVEIITSGYWELSEERNVLDILKQQYEKLFMEKYSDCIYHQLVKTEKELGVFKRYRIYENYFKQLLLLDGKNLIYNWVANCNIQHVSFYGLSEISKLFVTWFKEWNVTIDYIVEESAKKEYEGITLIKRSKNIFPETDAMIITDLNKEPVQKKLIRLEYAGFVTDYEKLLKDNIF